MNKDLDEKSVITELLMGPVSARSIYVAADLGIADRLFL